MWSANLGMNELNVGCHSQESVKLLLIFGWFQVFYGLDFVWAWLDPIWCVKHAEEIALLCLDNTLLIIELDASFPGTLYGFM